MNLNVTHKTCGRLLSNFPPGRLAAFVPGDQVRSKKDNVRILSIQNSIKSSAAVLARFLTVVKRDTAHLGGLAAFVPRDQVWLGKIIDFCLPYIVGAWIFDQGHLAFVPRDLVNKRQR